MNSVLHTVVNTISVSRSLREDLCVEFPPSSRVRDMASVIQCINSELPVKSFVAEKIAMNFCSLSCASIMCFKKISSHKPVGHKSAKLKRNISHTQTHWGAVKSCICPRVTASRKNH